MANKLLILCDLAGTLHNEYVIIPGALEAVRRMQMCKRKCFDKLICVIVVSDIHLKFVTNTTKESRRVLHNKLTHMGFDIEIDKLHTSLTAAADLLRKKNLRPMLFLEDTAMEDFNGVEMILLFLQNKHLDIPTDNPNCVVVGLAPTQFHYDKLNSAFRLMHNDKCAELIAIHKGKYYRYGLFSFYVYMNAFL